MISNWLTIKDPEPTTVRCTHCKSYNTKRDGIRKNKNDINQKYECLDCGGYFSIRGRKKPDESDVKKAIEIYNTGLSLRKTQTTLAINGINVTHKTIANWIKANTSR